MKNCVFKTQPPNATFFDEVCLDIIAGFPTETEKDFQDTMDLCAKYKFASLFMNQFFPRPGTPAAKWEQISRQVIKERTKRLSELFKR